MSADLPPTDAAPKAARQQLPHVVGASPWATAGPHGAGDGTARRAARFTRTVVDQLTVLALVAASGVMLAVLTPIAWNNWIEPPPSTARRGIARALRTRGYALPVADPGRGKAARRGGAHKLETLFPELRKPKRKRSTGVEMRGMAVTLGPAQLLSEPAADAEMVAELPSGTVVFVMRENPPWALVAQTAGSEMVFGWVQRRRLSNL